MSITDALMKQEKKVVGIKQVNKAIQRDLAKCVYIAKDADIRLLQPLIALCKSKAIELQEVASKHELGKACGIQTGASAVAVLK